MSVAALHKLIQRLCFCTALFLCAESRAQQPYFQQQVDYTITVTLNDTAHTLSAFEKIRYTNHSPTALDVIYFHLWPNGYKDHTTALCRQLLEQGNSKLYFSTPQERGYIDSLAFRVNGKSILWEYDPEHHDICKLILNEPLPAGASAEISTPFFVKIPDARFSRLGHTGQAYFITQWYPKPAVFDHTGWHQMPYLDQGEFYSEFGSFDVSITVPENYLLCATGDRVDAAEEEKFLEEKAKETQDYLRRADYRPFDIQFPPSSKTAKTIRFKQSQVHDFAWFADKRFHVVHDAVQLPESKRTVDTWVFFTSKNAELWRNAIHYVNESTLFYSGLNGDYPYRHVTAVDGTIMAGGGMEYPNITVIGDVSNAFELDITITHEVGHNWFYGMLGSNEREHPFMDEGVNSFYEMRYIRAKYPGARLVEYIGRDTSFRLLRINKVPVWKTNEVAFFSAAKAHNDQAIDLHAEDYTVSNYGSVVYSKTALVFDYLMDYMGAEKFDKAMRLYFERYKFRHPSPDDLFNTLSSSSGMSLELFKQHLIRSTDRIDYKISSVKRLPDNSYAIRVKNKGTAPMPFNIYGFDRSGKPGTVTWLDGFEGARTFTLTAGEVDRFKIDGLERMPDLNRRNNERKTHGLFPRARPLQLSLLTAMEDPSKTQLNYLPVSGANYYNGFMLGLCLHNYSFYQKKFEWSAAPLYGFRSKSAAGFAECNFNFYPKKAARLLTIGVKVKSFAYDVLDNSYINESFGTAYKSQYLNYYKVAPYIQAELRRKRATSTVRQLITYSNTNLYTDSIDFSLIQSTNPGPLQKKSTYSFVNQLSYSLYNSRAIDPFSCYVNLQHNARMAKIAATLNYQVTLAPKYNFELRAFAGAFLAGDVATRSDYSFRAAGYSGYQDYLFEGNFAARNQLSGFGFSQFMEQDGALKVYTPLGQSAWWLAAVNVKTPRLFILPLRLYADVAACDGRALLNNKLLWDAGINLTILKDIVEVYVPLAYSNDIKQTLQLSNTGFFNRIRFTFNIHKLAPKSILQSGIF